MKAVFFRDRTIEMIQAPRPKPGPGQALLRVLAAGICNTDLELFQGYYDFTGVPGHEFTARVEQCPQRPELEGARVAAGVNVGCGRCPDCLAGDPRHCPQRRVIGIKGLDGAFAEFLLAPMANLHPADPGLDDLEAVFAEPLAAALEISRQVDLAKIGRMAVLGDGKLGLLIALALRCFNPGLILAGRHERKLKLARDQGVETHLLEGGKLPDKLRGLDLVAEATGRPESLDLALDMVRPRGVVALKTTSHRSAPVNLSKAVVNEISILGSRCGPMDLALEFLARRRLDVRPLVEAVYPFERFPEAFEHARRPGALKVLLRFDAD